MEQKNSFVPMLAIGSGVTDLKFYERAFGATQTMRINNPDGSVHVAEFSLGEAIFRFHEDNPRNGKLGPDKAGGVTTSIGLLVDDVHHVVEQAIIAGAELLSPVTDYDYGLRQGEIKDPLGHHWIIEKILDPVKRFNYPG